MKLKDFPKLIILPLSLSVLLFNCGGDEETNNPEEETPKAPKISQPSTPTEDPGQKEIDKNIAIIDANLNKVMVLPGATSIETIGLAALNTLRDNVSKIDLINGIDTKFINNSKVKNKLVEADNKRKNLYDAMDARAKVLMKEEFIDNLDLMIGELEDIKQDVSAAINAATALSITNIVLQLKSQVNRHELVPDQAIKEDNVIVNNLGILSAKKQELLNHIDNEANIKSQQFSLEDQERVLKEREENAEKERKGKEEKEKLEEIENKYMPIIGSAKTIEELDSVLNNINNESNGIDETLLEDANMKMEIFKKLKTSISVAKKKIKDATELDFENNNKNNVQEKERIETEFKNEKNKFNELNKYIESNKLVFSMDEINGLLKQIGDKLRKFKVKNCNNGVGLNRVACEKANTDLVTLKQKLYDMNILVENDKIEKANKKQEAENIINNLKGIFPNGSQADKDRFLEETVKALNITKPKDKEASIKVLGDILSTADTVNLYDMLKDSNDFKNGVAGGNRTKIKNIFENKFLRDELLSDLGKNPKNKCSNTKDLFSSLMKLTQKQLASKKSW